MKAYFTSTMPVSAIVAIPDMSVENAAHNPFAQSLATAIRYTSINPKITNAEDGMLAAAVNKTYTRKDAPSIAALSSLGIEHASSPTLPGRSPSGGRSRS